MGDIILFSGDNLKHYEESIELGLYPKKWTTGAIQAMQFAFDCARKYDSEMVVYSLENPNLDVFRVILGRTASVDSDDIKWFEWDPSQEQVESEELESKKEFKVYQGREIYEYLKTYAPFNAIGTCSSVYLDELLLKLEK